MVSYCVMLDVPRDLILFVSRLLAGHRREIGTRKGTRRPGRHRQALFALAWFRTKGTSRGSAAASGCRSPPRTATWTRSSTCSRPARRGCRSSWSAPWPRRCRT